MPTAHEVEELGDDAAGGLDDERAHLGAAHDAVDIDPADDVVDVDPLDDPEEINEVKLMLHRHADYTQSERAKAVLANWDQMVSKFVKVLPNDYKRMLACIKRAHDQGLTGEEAIMNAFEENARDLSRVGGN